MDRERLKAVLRERIAMACKKACGFSQTIEDGRVKRTMLHSPECAHANAVLDALATPDAKEG